MMRISNKTDYVYNKLVKENITIIHISDIHFNEFTKKEKLIKIYNNIIKNKPDYVIITGDILDKPKITKNKYKIKELLDFLTNIANNSRLIISIGNHDIKLESDYKFFDNLNELKNIYVLNNSSYKDDKIFISGLTLPSNYYYNGSRIEDIEVFLETLTKNRKLIDKLPENLPKVLLSHSPVKIMRNEVLEEIYNYDLVLSGHTHGGMIPDVLNRLLRGNYGIISPTKRLFPSIARGRIDKYYKNKNITLIISSGITKLSESSTKILSKLNFLYNMSVNKIILTKERGNKNEN